MNFQTTLNDALKERFIEVVGDCEFGGCESAAQAPYYLADLQDNLIEPMDARHAAEYGGGSGNDWLLIIGTRWKFAHICPWSRSLKSFPENRIPII